MPYRLFHSSEHDADTINLMTQVFDEICTELGLVKREDKLRDLIAHEIIQCVGKGDRDPEYIRGCARKALHMQRLKNG